MSTSARKISETFNGRREWQIGGASFFKLLGTINPVDVELYLEGRQRLVAAQVEGGFYQRIDFDRVVITTGGAELVDWLFGPADGGSDRFTGAVTVSGPIASITAPVNLDPEDARYFLFGDDESADGEAFHGGAVAGPVAAQVSFVQLWNPAASGKVAYVDLIEFANLTATSRFELRENAAALGAVLGEWNKSIGGAAAVCELRQGSSAAPGGTVIRNDVCLVNVKERIEPKAPFRIPPGNGLFIVGFTVNQICLGNFEWREKPT